MKKTLLNVLLILLFGTTLYAQDWTELQKILPEARPANFSYEFGTSVAVDGNYAVIGMGSASTVSGYASVYYYNGSNWEKVAKLTASDNETDNIFGYSVDISGDNIVVGAYFDDHDGYTNAGTVYVFTKPVTGWTDMTETAALTASDALASDYLGYSVSISGDVIVAGASGDDDPVAGSSSGSAYVFVKPAEGWMSGTETAKLTASDAAASDFFGRSVSISGDNIVIGAELDDEVQGTDCGSAYVFTKPVTGWSNMTEAAKLTNSNGAASDYFGYSVSIWGDDIVIGARSNSSLVYKGGGAYVFTKPVSGWISTSTPTANLAPSFYNTYFNFGESVSIHKDVIVVSNNQAYETTFVYEKPAAGGWVDATENAKLTGSDEDNTDRFGASVSVSTDHILIGNDWDDDIIKDCGSVYFYKKPVTGNWADAEEDQKVIDDISYTNLEDNFGNTVAIDGNYAVVGAKMTDDDNENEGCAFVLYNNGTNWELQAKLTASDAAKDDYFGNSVSISGDDIVIGASYAEDPGYTQSGLAYVFTKPAGGWTDMTETAKLESPVPVNSEYFGSSVTILNDIIVVGAFSSGTLTGSAYIFVKPVGGWVDAVSDYTLTPSDATKSFGSSVSMTENEIVVGAKYDGDVVENGGALYVYTKPVTGWATTSAETAKLTVSNVETWDMFGYSVDISGNDIIASSYYGEYVYIFSKPVTGWVDANETAKLSILGNTGNIGQQSDKSVSIQGNIAVVGDAWDNESGTNTGAVLVYEKPADGWVDMTETSKINASDFELSDFFGNSVAMSGNYIIAGAFKEDESDTDAGAAYIYKMPIPAITGPDSQSNICPGSTIQFSISATYADIYQWQASIDGGVTFLNLTEASPYSGTQTDTLSILTSSNMTGFQFRCLVGNSTGTSTSNVASLMLDSVAPVITSTHNDQAVTDEGNCQATLADYTGTITAMDNCDTDLSLSQTPAPGTVFTGITTVTLSVEDDLGNTDEVYFHVEINDNIVPTITSIHPDQSVNADNNCEAILPDYTVNVTAEDNCDNNLTITQSPVPGTIISGVSNNITLYVEDYSGNTSTAVFNVSVSDSTNPVITSTHEDITLDADANCEASLPDYTGSIIAEDNCDTDLTVSQSPLPGTVISGQTNEITLSVYDDAGNSAEVTFNVNVTDVTEPVADISVLPDLTDECSVSAPEAPTATDNCAGLITGTTTTEFPVTTQGTTVITWTFNDGNGNTATQTQNIIINDITDPVTIVLEDLIGECSVTAGAPETTDNCAGTITGTTSDPLEYTEQGTYTITWTFDDGNGNSINVDQNVIIDDTTNPVTPVLEDLTGECSVTANAPVTTDNCAGTITGTTSDPLEYTEQGTYTITWTFDDGNGNSTNAAQNVIVDDITNPTITCASDAIITLDEGQSYYTVSGSEFDPVSTDDNCSTAYYENDINNTGTLNGEQFAIGSHSVTWTVYDDAGNLGSCVFNLTVNEFVDVVNNGTKEFSVYPNPTSGFIFIKTTQNNFGVSLMDINGKILYGETNLNGNCRIDMSSYTNGIYFIKLRSAKNVQRIKIIKQ